jgi:hypothetical protein
MPRRNQLSVVSFQSSEHFCLKAAEANILSQELRA